MNIKCNLKFELISIWIILLSCSTPKNVPGNKYLAGDKIITGFQSIITSEQPNSSGLQTIPRIRSFAYDRTRRRLILLGWSGELLFLDQSGHLLLTRSTYGQGPGEMTLPRIMKFRNGKLFVLDYGNNKICVYASDGKWITDLVIHDQVIETFAVDEMERVIVPAIRTVGTRADIRLTYHSLHSAAKTEKNTSFSMEDSDLTILRPLLELNNRGNLILGFRIEGNFYQLDSSCVLLSRFSIQGGPEWEENLKFEERIEKHSSFGKTYPHRVTHIDFDEQGNIWINWGGPFKKESTIAAIFNPDGLFSGRLFLGKKMPAAPLAWILDDDSTMIAYIAKTEEIGFCSISTR